MTTSPKPRRRAKPFLILALYFALLGISLWISERNVASFHHPSWRLREMQTLLRDAREEPTELLCIGSSRIMAGVQPVLVEESYREERPEESLRGRNFGIEKGDWENAYLLLQRHLRTAGAPRILLAEVGQIDLTRGRHRLLRNLISPRDLPVIWPDWSLAEAVELSFSVLGRGPLDAVHALVVPDDDEQDSRARAGWVLYPGNIDQAHPQHWFPLSKRRPVDVLRARGRAHYDTAANVGLLKRYVPRVADLCKQHAVRLVFLHMPQLYEARLSESQLQYFSRFGEVLEPYYPALYQADRYKEVRHLNAEGSAELSRQIGKFLAGTDLPSIEAWLQQQSD